MESRDETTLIKQRLHWGIFVPVAIVAFGVCVFTLPVLFMLNGFNKALADLNPHGASNMPLMLLILIPDFVIVAGSLAVVWAAYATCEITLTNRRILFRTGLISRHSGELPLENVESVFITESLLGRLFGFGTVTVTSVGGQALPFQFIGSPQRFYSTLNEFVDSAKKTPVTQKQSPPADDSRYMPRA